MPYARFIEGPAGTGKTTVGIETVRELLDQGAAPEGMLVLVPHPALGQPYQAAFAAPDWPSGAQIDVLTLTTLVRRSLENFWPLIAARAGFAEPEREPTFLNLETAQYYMSRFVREARREGLFDSVNVTPFRIVSQTLDNLSKAAVNRFSLDDVARRLIAAWGDRHSSRPLVYHSSLDIARRFREYCLRHSLLDYSLQVEVFFSHLLHEPVYLDALARQYQHLVADNLEENVPVVAEFIDAIWDGLETALLLYDTEAGYRVFLGADPAGMLALRERCADVQHWDQPVYTVPAMHALTVELDRLLDPARAELSLPPPDANPLDGFVFSPHRFYPEMIDWVVAQIAVLVDEGTPPHEIVVLSPFLGDSLRFMLTTRLESQGIPAVSHRPSRAVCDEPAARAILTLMALAHPEWDYHPPAQDVADALQQTIDGLDPVRAWLLAQIIYRPQRGDLGSFDAIQAPVQERITYHAGERYEVLRRWLRDYQENLSGAIPPDHFLSRLFGEVLSQPGYGFHTHLDAGRVVAELVESAYRFRQTLYPQHAGDWRDVGSEYFTLVQEGLLAGLYVASWRDEQRDAVFLAPAHTFLMRNRRVDVQFWLDVGSSYWWERLEQPLTHPYVLTRDYPEDQVWTDELEFKARQEALRRLVVGLTRRCRRTIYACMSNLGESGYEQRGPLLQVFQQLIQRQDIQGEPL